MARPSCCRRARRGITLRTRTPTRTPRQPPGRRGVASRPVLTDPPFGGLEVTAPGGVHHRCPLAGTVTLPDLGGRERTDDRGERGPGVTQLAGRILTLGRGRAQQLLETVAEVSRPVGPVHAGAARFLVSGERVTRVPYLVLGCSHGHRLPSGDDPGDAPVLRAALLISSATR